MNDDNYYRIVNTITGEYFRGLRFERGKTKKGNERKSGPGKFVAEFGPHLGYMTKHMLNYQIKNAIEKGAGDSFENTEIEAYKMAPTKTTLKMKTVKRRIEATELIKRLKAT